MLACRKWPELYQGIDKVFINDPDIALAAIQKDSEMYKHFREEIDRSHAIARNTVSNPYASICWEIHTK